MWLCISPQNHVFTVTTNYAYYMPVFNNSASVLRACLQNPEVEEPVDDLLCDYSYTGSPSLDSVKPGTPD